MPDWRDKGGRGPKKDAGRTPPAKPAAPDQRSSGTSAPQPIAERSARRKGWRKGSSAGPPSHSSDRSWQGAGPGEENVSRRTLFRWGLRAVLSVAAIVLTAVFVWVVFVWPRKLPLAVISVGEMVSGELRENLLGQAERAAWLEVNSGNIEVSPQDKDRDEDYQQLEGMVREDGEIRAARLTLKSRKGPGRNLFAVYVGAVAVSRPDPGRLSASPGNETSSAELNEPETLWLVPRTGTPWPDGRAEAWDRKLVRLDDLLHCVASSVEADRGWAWLILDLRQPSLVAEATDLDCQWKTQLAAALERLKTEFGAPLHDRLIVTLACDDGQQNWLAPEAGGTFFGFWLKRGLSGGFDGVTPTWPFQTLTLAQFRKALDERVRNSVAIRRHATQVPVWLPEPSRDMADLQLVSIAGAAPVNPRRVTGLGERFDQIDGLWSRFQEKPADPWRWDPLRVAIAEQRLVALESLAMGDGTGFNAAITAAEKAIAQIGSLPPPPPVSLVEQKLHLEFVRGTEANKKLDRQNESLGRPETERDQLIWSSSRATVLPEVTAPLAQPAEVPDEHKPGLVWETLVAKAAREDFGRFVEPDLKQALEFANSADPGSVELQLLRLLHDEVEWQPDTFDETRRRTVGRAIEVFDLLQQSASIQASAVVQHATGELKTIEARFLVAFDQLLAGHFAIADPELETIRSETRVLHGRLQEMALAIEARDRAFRVVPHLVTWSLMQRQYQPAMSEGAASPIDERLESLAETWELACQLDDATLKGHVWAADPGQRPPPIEELDRELKGLENQLATAVRQVTGEVSDPDSIARTLRERMQLLKTPLLTARDRKDLHAKVAEYLLEDATSWLSASSTADVPTGDLERFPRWTEGAIRFVDCLEGESNKQFWRSALSGAMRYRLGESTAVDELLPPPTSATGSDDEKLRAELTRQARYARVAASVFASVETSQSDQLAKANLAWGAAWQAASLDRAEQFDFQRRRLLAAAWGNGGPEAEPSCLIQAGLYVPNLRQPELEGLKWFADRLDESWLAAHESLATRLGQLGARLAPGLHEVEDLTQGVEESIITGTGGSDWTGSVADVKFIVGSTPLPLSRSGSATTSDGYFPPGLDHQIALPLDPESGSATMTVNVNPNDRWQGGTPPDLTLAWRGHRRSVKADWNLVIRETSHYELLPAARPARDATVTVRRPNDPVRLNVILLLDCSSSTTTVIKLGQGDAAGEEYVLCDELKKTTVDFMKSLREQHAAQSREIHFAIMPFGYRLDPGEEPGRLNGRDGESAPQPGETIFLSQLKPLDVNWANQLEIQVKRIQVKPGSDTPLYSAMCSAIARLRQPDLRGISMICVLSDGVNQPSAAAPESDRAEIQNVELELEKAPAVKVRIFFFDVFSKYIPTAMEEWESGDPEERIIQPTDAESRKQFKADEYKKVEKDLRLLYDKGMKELKAFEAGYSGQVEFEPAEADGFPNLKRAFLNVIPQPKLEATLVRLSGEKVPVGAIAVDVDFWRFTIPETDTPCRIEVSFTSGLESAGPGTSPAAGATSSFPLAGGEDVELNLAREGEQLSLEFPAFAEATKPHSLRLVDELAGNSSGLNVYQDRTLEQGGKQLKYYLGFERLDGSFCGRPGFFLLQVQSSRPAPRTILTPDFHWDDNTHYPVAKLDGVASVDVEAPDAKIWWAMDMPAAVKQVVASVGESSEGDAARVRQEVELALGELGLDPESLSVQVRPGVGTVTVETRYEIEPDAARRLVVFCPAAEQVVRKIDEEVTEDKTSGGKKHRITRETATFRLPDKRASDQATLMLVTPGKLDEQLAREQSDAQAADTLWMFVPRL